MSVTNRTRTRSLLEKYSFILKRRDRLGEYAENLDEAKSNGYRLTSHEAWLLSATTTCDRVLVLRHDVDAFGQSASRMSDVERQLGVASTFYFRWSTWDRAVAERILENGSQIGFHYETLTRYCLENGLMTPESITNEVIAKCRAILRIEVAAFKEEAGSCFSVVAHGDYPRELIKCENDLLLRGEDPTSYGIGYDGDSAEVKERIDLYVTDGEGFPSYWSRSSLSEAVASGARVVVLNTHPHHWIAGWPVVVHRAAAQLQFLAQHPASWERGKPEAFAWHRYRPAAQYLR